MASGRINKRGKDKSNFMNIDRVKSMARNLATVLASVLGFILLIFVFTQSVRFYYFSKSPIWRPLIFDLQDRMPDIERRWQIKQAQLAQRAPTPTNSSTTTTLPSENSKSTPESSESESGGADDDPVE